MDCSPKGRDSRPSSQDPRSPDLRALWMLVVDSAVGLLKQSVERLHRSASHFLDRGIRPARDVEIVPAGHEVGVRQAQRRRHQTADVDARARAEHDAVRVEQEDAAI